jgi:uncharacterized membrane protein YidH (DUF202 family)
MDLWDPGLQPERTALAWRRTAIATASAALVVVREAVAHGAWPATAGAIMALLIAAETIRQSSAAYARAADRLRTGVPLKPLADPLLMTAAVLVLAGSAIATALT